MYLDVTEMQTFYASRLGRVVRRLLRDQVKAVWPDLADRRVLGLGYATPLFAAGTTHAPLQFMPARQGVMRWPRQGANRAALVEDDELPLPDNCMDRIIICHALENTDNMRRFLREIWRVLAPEGRLLVIAPHRRSLWALMERTPFGHGRPFTTGQMNRLLRDQMFEPLQSRGSLYGWPGNGPLSTRMLGLAERLGKREWTGMSGVILVEAKKTVEAPINGRVGERVAVPARA